MSAWYKLDNAAKVYTATKTRNFNAVFRLSATLKETIKPDVLRTAVSDLHERFPSFFVQLRQGVFWYYLEPAEDPNVIEQESQYPCRPLPVGRGIKPMFRILYYKDRISLEVFHTLTDGFGALTFFKSVLFRYLELCGKKMPEAMRVIPGMRDQPNPAELEDSFQKYYDPQKKLKRKEPKSYHYMGRRSNDDNYYRIITARFSVVSLKKITKEKGVTITQYLTALLILAFANNIPDGKRKAPIRVSVPINLRKVFASASLRNFSYFANVGVRTSPDITIDEILASIVPQLNEGFEKDILLRNFCMNVRPERNFFLRLFPLFIKNIGVRIVSSHVGEARFTSCLSNLGAVDLPTDMAIHFKEFDFALGPSHVNGLNMTAISFGDNMSVSFQSFFIDTAVQSYFFKYLSDLGLKMEVESNV